MTVEADHLVLTADSTASKTPAMASALMGRSPDDLRRVCEDIAAEAATLVRSSRSGAGSRVGVTETKSSAVDPVTEIDRASEALIRERISAHVSVTGASDVILGEEEGGEILDGRVTWVVDPVDGTVNLIYGIPASAVSIAATVDGVPVAGAVADIARHRVVSACVGEPARISWTRGDRDDQLLQRWSTEDPADFSRALIGTGFSYRAENRAAQAELLGELLPQIRDIRRIGSAALDLCAVAAGRIDGYFEHGLGPWDHAAGALIAARSGAVVHMPRLSAGYGDGIPVVAAAPSVVGDLAGVVVGTHIPEGPKS